MSRDFRRTLLLPYALSQRLKVSFNVLANQTANGVWLGKSSDETQQQQRRASLAALIGIAPKDELEAMLAAQLIVSHNAAMECYRRAMIGEQTFEGRRENLNQANKLSLTHATLLEALNRHRGKGQQKVTLEHVYVHAGGQAVVGMVESPAGGDRTKSKDQPHAKVTADTSQSSLRSADAEGERVPITSDAERPLPDARRKVSRRA